MPPPLVMLYFLMFVHYTVYVSASDERERERERENEREGRKHSLVNYFIIFNHAFLYHISPQS